MTRLVPGTVFAIAAVFLLSGVGLAKDAGPWVDFSRGFESDRHGEDGAVSGAASEMPMRVQFQAWVDYMTREAA